MRKSIVNVIKRFNRKYKINELTQCWEWTGAIVQDGYGQFWDGRVKIGAHRFSYLIFIGEIPNNLSYVCHKCDNPKCVSPFHLFLGTPKDNYKDSVDKGRRLHISWIGRRCISNKNNTTVCKAAY